MARILIVDDSTLQARSLQQLLEAAGHSVACAQHLMGARRILRGFQPRMLLIELVLWRGNGFSLAAALGNDNMITVLMSARHQPADRHWAQARGIHHVLARPQSRDTLLSSVEVFLENGSEAGDCRC